MEKSVKQFVDANESIFDVNWRWTKYFFSKGCDIPTFVQKSRSFLEFSDKAMLFMWAIEDYCSDEEYNYDIELYDSILRYYNIYELELKTR